MFFGKRRWARNLERAFISGLLTTREKSVLDSSMRSVWFYLDADVVAVEAALQRAGAVRVGTSHLWNYPPEDTTLFISCGPFDGVSDDPDELAEFRAETNDAPFKAHVHTDVSGRVPGDAEVRYLARALLGQFDGVAFDDFTWPHAWSLDAIEKDARHDGLGFFDYTGAFEQKHAERER